MSVRDIPKENKSFFVKVNENLLKNNNFENLNFRALEELLQDYCECKDMIAVASVALTIVKRNKI